MKTDSAVERETEANDLCTFKDVMRITKLRSPMVIRQVMRSAGGFVLRSQLRVYRSDLDAYLKSLREGAA